MPYDPNDDEIIRHENLRQWLAYKVGPHQLKGWWILAAWTLVVALVGHIA